MNQLQPGKSQTGKNPEETRQKSRPSLPGQRALQDNIRAIGMALQAGVCISALSAEQLQIIGQAIGNAALIRLLGDQEAGGRCLQGEGEAWEPESLLAERGLPPNEIDAGPPDLGGTPLFEAVDVARIAPSNPFAGGDHGGPLWSG